MYVAFPSKYVARHEQCDNVHIAAANMLRTKNALSNRLNIFDAALVIWEV